MGDDVAGKASPAHIAQAVFQLPSSAFSSPSLVNPGQEPGQDQLDTLLQRGGSIVLMNSLTELDEARPRYVEADEMYDGEVGDRFASEQVAKLLAKSGVNDVEDLNYAKVPVDTIADKLQILAVTASSGDDATSSDTADGDAEDESGREGQATAEKAKKKVAAAAQEKIDEIRKRNQLDIEETELELKACKYGEAYLFVWPVTAAPDDDEDPLVYDGAAQVGPDHQGRTVGVDMLVNGPYTCRAFYDPENPLKMSHVLKAWEWVDAENDEVRMRATLYFNDRIERWVVKPSGNADKKEDWQHYTDSGEDGDGQWPLPNPTGRIPFFHFRNARPYGKPEHRSAYGPQRLINKLVGAHAVTVDYQSFPQRYLLMDPKGDDQLMNLVDPDNPEDDDDDPEGDGRSQLRADPSALWRLWGSQVGQFAVADPGVFLQPLDRYIKSISELCGIPLSRFTGYSTPPSGESRKVENEPLYERTRKLHRAHGGVWQDAYEFALELQKVTDVTVSVKWKPVQTASGKEDWEIIKSKMDSGVPVLTVLTEAGYPEDEVEKWLTDETGADLVRRVALLNSIGTAVQALAAGVAVGLISPPQAGEIVAKIIGAIGEELPDLAEPVDLHPQLAQQALGMQKEQRGQQMAEHLATAPPQPAFDPAGKPIDQGPPRELPAPPPPPAPVKVGGKK